jgi:hypothetical protein
MYFHDWLTSMHGFLNGATFALSITASLLFLRFYRRTRDRLFLFFSASFAVIGLNRLLFLFDGLAGEHEAIPYIIRLAAFVLILYAIIDKNRRRDSEPPRP